MDSSDFMKENTKKGPKWKRSRYVDMYFQKHHPFHTISKTLADPQNRLSRNQKKEIYENSDLNFRCEYSIDKNRRWESLKPDVLAEFTEMKKYNGIDFYLAEEYRNTHHENINRINFIRNSNEIISVENTGRMTSMKSMIYQASGTPCVAYRGKNMEKWKDAVIPPRIMYNVSKMHSCKGLFYSMFRTGGHWGYWKNEIKEDKGELELFLYNQSYVCSCLPEYDDEHWAEYLDDQADAQHLEVDEDAREFLSDSRKSTTLSDFIVPTKKRTRNRSLATTEDTSNDWELMNEEKIEEEIESCVFTEKIENEKFNLISNRSQKNEKNLEKVFSNQCGHFGSFVIHYSGDQQTFIDELHNFSDVVKWIDAQRALCDLTRLLTNPSESAERSQLFVAFHLSLPIVKITINTIYPADRMLDMLLRYSFRNDTKGIVDAILFHILKVVQGWKEKKYIEKKMDSRCTRQPHLFSSQANSTLHGTFAIAPTRSEVLSAIRENETDLESTDDKTMIICTQAEKCTLCEIDSIEQPFPTVYGNLCSNCVRLLMFTQMIAGKATTIFSSEYSTIDILPFFVPLKQIDIYYNRVAAEVLNVGHWLLCPRCDKAVFLPFAQDLSNKFDADVICNECSSHFCALCLSEPHFPLSCAEHVDWSLLFEDYYAVMTRKTNLVWRITCICGVLIEIEEGQETSQCSGCGKAFSPRHIQLQQAHQPLIIKDARYHAVQRLYHFDGGAYKVKVLQKKKVSLDGRYGKPALAARQWRLDQVAQRILVDDLKKNSASRSIAVVIKETCKLAQMIIENGYGLLYLYRYEECREEWKALSRLYTLLWDFLNTRRIELLKPLEKNLQSAIKLFSHFDHHLY